MSARPAPASAGPGPGELAQLIRERVDAVLQQASGFCRVRGVRLPQPEVRFDLTGQTAGQVRWERRRPPVLRFNLSLAAGHLDDFLAVTVVHEVAHLAVAACHPRARPHGPEWRAMMQLLGVTEPTRCHDYTPVPARRQRRWAYRCGCREHQLTTTRHKRVEAGAVRYHCRVCGGPLHPVGGQAPAPAS
jgi:SprT protein